MTATKALRTLSFWGKRLLKTLDLMFLLLLLCICLCAFVAKMHLPGNYWRQLLKEEGRKKIGQVTHIAPLQPSAFARFPAWRIEQELVV